MVDRFGPLNLMHDNKESRSYSDSSRGRCDCGDCIEWGAAAPILGATTGAFVGDVATEVMMSDKSKGMNMDNCAPDNFWTLLGDLASMGGWLLILVIIIPMVLGWFLPGPVKLKGRDKPPINPYLK